MEKIKVTKKEFKELMQVLNKVAKDDTRPILQGVLFEENKVVAIDGYRMSVRHGNFNLESKYVIDSNTLKEVVKACKGDIKEVEVEFNNNPVFNLFDKEKNIVTTIQGRFLEGTYLNYKSLMPREFTGAIEIDSKKILDIIKPLKKNTRIVLEIKNNHFNLYRMEENFKKETSTLILLGFVKVKAIVTNNIIIGINTTNLKEAINDYKQFIFKYNNTYDAMVINDIEEKNMFDMILPLRLIGDFTKAS